MAPIQLKTNVVCPTCQNYLVKAHEGLVCSKESQTAMLCRGAKSLAALPFQSTMPTAFESSATRTLAHSRWPISTAWINLTQFRNKPGNHYKKPRILKFCQVQKNNKSQPRNSIIVSHLLHAFSWVLLTGASSTLLSMMNKCITVKVGEAKKQKRMKTWWKFINFVDIWGRRIWNMHH